MQCISMHDKYMHMYTGMHMQSVVYVIIATIHVDVIHALTYLARLSTLLFILNK